MKWNQDKIYPLATSVHLYAFMFVCFYFYSYVYKYTPKERNKGEPFFLDVQVV